LNSHAADRLPSLLLAALLLAAFAFGGGGIGAPLGNLTVQLAALAVLALRREGFVQFWRESPLAMRALVMLSLALPLLQIIPLPESLWTALPARTMVAQSLEAIGESGWMPFSLFPQRTLLAVTALVTPLAVLCAGWTLPRERLIDLGWLIVGCGLFTVLLGAVQLGGPPGTAKLYDDFHGNDVLVGTFANRNSVGLFLTFALGLAALLPAPRPHPALLWARLAACTLLLLGVAFTQSRTALVLAILPVLLGTMRGLDARLRARKGNGSGGRMVLIGLGALALVGIAGGALVIAAPGRLDKTLERFEQRDDPRRYVWEDATYSAGKYWPLGAGVGTFDELYQVDESLENVTLRRPGRAHNEYIEVAIESGAPGLLLLAGWAVLISWLSWRARRSKLRWAAWAGSAFLLATALQSITDYPLRNQAMLAFAAFALLLLARIATERQRSDA
jgi:exopolysaccharide production protein ExoQ